MVFNQIIEFCHGLFESKYSRMDHVKFFKGCPSQILLGPFLNTLSHLSVFSYPQSRKKIKVFIFAGCGQIYPGLHGRFVPDNKRNY